jgi:hypothetical protein
MKHLKDPMPSIIKANDTVPQSVENIVLKATAKNPKNRLDVVNKHGNRYILLASDIVRFSFFTYGWSYLRNARIQANTSYMPKTLMPKLFIDYFFNIGNALKNFWKPFS